MDGNWRRLHHCGRHRLRRSSDCLGEAERDHWRPMHGDRRSRSHGTRLAHWAHDSPPFTGPTICGVAVGLDVPDSKPEAATDDERRHTTTKREQRIVLRSSLVESKCSRRLSEKIPIIIP